MIPVAAGNLIQGKLAYFSRFAKILQNRVKMKKSCILRCYG
jgi:hypothetical protein